MEAIQIDLFRPEDAPGVARLFREVYGEGYPIRAYYDPARLIAENAAGRILSNVARTPDGQVVAHNALVLLDAGARLYENAAGAVLPAFRGQGIFFQVMEHSIREVARAFAVEEILGEPVCNHLQIQKMCLKLDYRETGLEVELMPAAAYSAKRSARGRVSVLLGYFRHRPMPQRVHLPPVYGEALGYLYSGLGLERAFAEAAEEALPVAGESLGGLELFDFAQVARIAVERIGADFEAFLARQEGRAAEKATEVFQLWLPLASPSVAAAAQILRRRGYFIGGLLPGGAGGDRLLMQKVRGETDWEGIALYSERARQIAEIVRSDQQRAR